MAPSVQGVDSFDDIVQQSPDELAAFIRKVEGQQQKVILEPNDINGIELGRRSTDGVFGRFLSSMLTLGGRSTDGVFGRFLSSITEAFVSSPCVVVAASNPRGSSEYARVTANINPPAIEKLSETDYNLYKQELETASHKNSKVVPYSTLSEAIWSVTEYFNNATEQKSWFPEKTIDIVIFSSHGIFSHEKRYCNSKDEASSILHEFRDMEKKILECAKKKKLSITPRIYIVTQLLPGVVNTPESYLLKKLKSAKNAHVVQITFRDNKGIFYKRTLESELRELREDIKNVTDKVLQSSPIMIFGSDRDGNQRASLFAKVEKAPQISGDKATEASWCDGARIFYREAKKIYKQ